MCQYEPYSLRVCCARRDFWCIERVTLTLTLLEAIHSHSQALGWPPNNWFLTLHVIYSPTPHRQKHANSGFLMASKLAPVTKPILRAQLSSKPSNGHASFVQQISKLVFEYSQNWPSSANTRTYLQNNLQNLARANPHVQVVVRQRNNRQPIVRGFYRTPFLYFRPASAVLTPSL